MIFGSRKLRLRGPDKSVVTDGPMIPDHADAEQYGHQGLRKLPRVRLGKLALYYRDLGKDYYVPYNYIDRSFVRISECQPDDSPAYYYYRIILVHGEKEFANLIINEEDVADRILERLKEIRPEIDIGFKHRFQAHRKRKTQIHVNPGFSLYVGPVPRCSLPYNTFLPASGGEKFRYRFSFRMLSARDDRPR